MGMARYNNYTGKHSHNHRQYLCRGTFCGEILVREGDYGYIVLDISPMGSYGVMRYQRQIRRMNDEDKNQRNTPDF